MLSCFHVPGDSQPVQSLPPFRKRGADLLAHLYFLRREWALRCHGHVLGFCRIPVQWASARLILSEAGDSAQYGLPA